jgi:tRNA(fMet)-specific endonuclease VapC
LLRFLLDTDICSYIMRGSHPSLQRRMRSAAIGEQAISVVTKAELLFGVSVSPRPEKEDAAVAAFLLHVDVLPLEDAVAQHYAEIRADLKARGVMIGANDLWLAAHARSLGLTLVTNNTREFERVGDLQLANWTEPA